MPTSARFRTPCAGVTARRRDGLAGRLASCAGDAAQRIARAQLEPRTSRPWRGNRRASVPGRGRRAAPTSGLSRSKRPTFRSGVMMRTLAPRAVSAAASRASAAREALALPRSTDRGGSPSGSGSAPGRRGSTGATSALVGLQIAPSTYSRPPITAGANTSGTRRKPSVAWPPLPSGAPGHRRRPACPERRSTATTRSLRRSVRVGRERVGRKSSVAAVLRRHQTAGPRRAASGRPDSPP